MQMSRKCSIFCLVDEAETGFAHTCPLCLLSGGSASFRADAGALSETRPGDGQEFAGETGTVHKSQAHTLIHQHTITSPYDLPPPSSTQVKELRSRVADMEGQSRPSAGIALLENKIQELEERLRSEERYELMLNCPRGLYTTWHLSTYC